ncbi:MAG: permease prefix domain 1-containing protein [Verrucomicrobiales bacterium]|nr:permease prefix domain 1-containing protein [Verrucomicrobiales bacterium]
MKQSHKPRSWFHRWSRKGQPDASMNDELRFHVDMLTQRHINAGMSEEEARRTAQRQFGRMDAIQERCREERAGFFARHLSLVVQDARFGLRTLIKNPGCTAIAVITRALGIMATTAMYSVIHAVVLEPFPYKKVDDLMSVKVWDAVKPQNYRIFYSTDQFIELAEQSSIFDGVVASTISDVIWTEGGDPQRRIPRFQQVPYGLENDGFQIVGVVKDTVNRGNVTEQVSPEIYLPFTILGDARSVVVLTQGDPASITRSVLSQVYAIDKNQPVTNVRTIERILSDGIYAGPRFNLAPAHTPTLERIAVRSRFLRRGCPDSSRSRFAGVLLARASCGADRSDDCPPK